MNIYANVTWTQTCWFNVDMLCYKVFFLLKKHLCTFKKKTENSYFPAMPDDPVESSITSVRPRLKTAVFM